MAAAVMGDAAVSVGAQKQHLVFPGVRAQRPAMAEDHGLSAAPVLVIEIDVARVFFTDSKVIHLASPFSGEVFLRAIPLVPIYHIMMCCQESLSCTMN